MIRILLLTISLSCLSIHAGTAQEPVEYTNFNGKSEVRNIHHAYTPITSGLGYSVYEYRPYPSYDGCSEYNLKVSLVFDPEQYAVLNLDVLRSVHSEIDLALTDYCPKPYSEKNYVFYLYWDGFVKDKNNYVYSISDFRQIYKQSRGQHVEHHFASYYNSFGEVAFKTNGVNWHMLEFEKKIGHTPTIYTSVSLPFVFEYAASLKAENETAMTEKMAEVEAYKARKMAEEAARARKTVRLSEWMFEKRKQLGFPEGPSDKLFVFMHNHLPDFWSNIPDNTRTLDTLDIEDAVVGIERYSRTCGKQSGFVPVDWSLGYSQSRVWVHPSIQEKYVQIRKRMGGYDFEVFSLSGARRGYSGYRAQSLERHHYDPLLSAWGCENNKWENFWIGFSKTE